MGVGIPSNCLLLLRVDGGSPRAEKYRYVVQCTWLPPPTKCCLEHSIPLDPLQVCSCIGGLQGLPVRWAVNPDQCANPAAGSLCTLVIDVEYYFYLSFKKNATPFKLGLSFFSPVLPTLSLLLNEGGRGWLCRCQGGTHWWGETPSYHLALSFRPSAMPMSAKLVPSQRLPPEIVF